MAMETLTGRMFLKIHLVRNYMISGPFNGLYEGLEKNYGYLFGFFTIGKSVRSDRNKMQFLRIITIENLNVRFTKYFQYLLDCGYIVK